MNISKYKTLVFDCDGVVLNSNKVKTEAFYKAALPYGEDAAQQLVDYHIRRGGISRYEKFEWFVQSVVAGVVGPSLEQLLAIYAEEVSHGLLNCDIANDLKELRQKTPDTNWLIVSGGDQSELRTLFKQRGIAELFDGGIFGSPDSKNTILEREIRKKNIITPALFIGDSKYDFHASSDSGLDFLFVYGWTEVYDWQGWVNEFNIKYINSISSL